MIRTCAVVVALTACSKPSEEAPKVVGALGLQLQQSSSIEIRTLRYQISQGSGAVRAGSLPIGSADTFVFQIAALPPADEYALSLDADAKLARGEATRCKATVPFDILASQSTTVAVHLRCDGQSTSGTPHAGGGANECPSVLAIRALPASAPLGSDVSLRADVEDANDGPSSLALTWTAPSGELSSPHAAKTNFRCTQPGVVKALLTVSDGDPACTDTSAWVYVTCGDCVCPDPSKPCPDAAAAGGAPGRYDSAGIGGARAGHAAPAPAARAGHNGSAGDYGTARGVGSAGQAGSDVGQGSAGSTNTDGDDSSDECPPETDPAANDGQSSSSRDPNAGVSAGSSSVAPSSGRAGSTSGAAGSGSAGASSGHVTGPAAGSGSAPAASGSSAPRLPESAGAAASGSSAGEAGAGGAPGGGAATDAGVAEQSQDSSSSRGRGHRRS